MSEHIGRIRAIGESCPSEDHWAAKAADHLEAVEAERDKWKALCMRSSEIAGRNVDLAAALRASTELLQAQQDVIVSYRVGRRPREKSLDVMAKHREQIAANEAALGD